VLINICDRNDRAARGTVGRMGSVMGAVMGHKIVKFDVIEEQPIRGKDGRCIECAYGEAGELLMPLKEDKPHTKFVGYTDDKSTSKKLIGIGFWFIISLKKIISLLGVSIPGAIGLSPRTSCIFARRLAFSLAPLCSIRVLGESCTSTFRPAPRKLPEA